MQLIGHALNSGILATVNGGSFEAGAVSGAGSELAAKAITQTLFGEEAAANPSILGEQEKTLVSDLSAVFGTVSGGLAGGSALNAQIGAVAGQNAVENNYLLKQDWDKYHKDISVCDARYSSGNGLGVCYAKAQSTLYQTSARRNSILKSACSSNGDIASCAKHVAEADLSKIITKQELDKFNNANLKKPLPAFVNYLDIPWSDNPSIHYWATSINIPQLNNFSGQLVINRVTGEASVGWVENPTKPYISR